MYEDRQKSEFEGVTQYPNATKNQDKIRLLLLNTPEILYVLGINQVSL